MYTLEQLQKKSLKELKEIGWELNVFPEADRRCRETWINAIAGVNPPLLQLLEVSPAVEVQAQEPPIIETVETSASVEVEPVEEAPLESKFGRIAYPRSAQKAISQVAKTSPGVEVEQAQDAISQVAKTSPGVEVEQAQDAIESRDTKFDCPRCQAVGSLHIDRDSCLENWTIRCLHCSYHRPMNPSSAYLSVPDPALDLFGIFPFKADLLRRIQPSKPIEVQAQEPIEPAAKNSPGVEVDLVDDELPECSECFDGGFIEEPWGSIRFCHCSKGSTGLAAKYPELFQPLVHIMEDSPGVTEPAVSQSAIVPASKNLSGSGSKTTAHQLLELFKSSAHIIEDSPGVKTEATVSESAIAPAAKNHLEEKSDQNPLLTGIPLSNRFVTRYTPPQPEIIHFQSDADGQLSLLDFEVESVDEAPDPDDFESLDAFREAIELWDREHPSSFDHCSDHLPSSAQNEPLEISLDSFCEWAPCPADWYEPDTSLEQSKVSELSSTRSSITSDFFIPTFDRLGDRRSDEPPDTGIFAKLPGPKPPKFPPQAIGQTHTKRNLNAFQSPNFDRIAAPQTHIRSSSTAQVETESKCRVNTYPPVIPINNAVQSNLKRISTKYPGTISKLSYGIATGSSTQPARSPPGGDACFA